MEPFNDPSARVVAIQAIFQAIQSLHQNRPLNSTPDIDINQVDLPCVLHTLDDGLDSGKLDHLTEGKPLGFGEMERESLHRSAGIGCGPQAASYKPGSEMILPAAHILSGGQEKVNELHVSDVVNRNSGESGGVRMEERGKSVGRLGEELDVPFPGELQNFSHRQFTAGIDMIGFAGYTAPILEKPTITCQNLEIR
nr:hypothetical protein Iba_chr08eCG1350 [Ipomoea batatas]